MRARNLWLAGLAIAAVAGCDWRDFDGIQNSTPVLAVEAPSGWPLANDFASLLVATQPPADGSAAARFLTSAILQTGLSVVTVSASGSGSAHNVSSPVLDQLDGQAITAMAAIPGTDQALLGVPQSQGGSVLKLDFSVLPAAVSAFGGISSSVAAEPLLGIGVAAGNLTGSATPDLVVSSGSGLHVYVGGGATELSAPTSAACPIAILAGVSSRDRIQRAMVIGKLTGATSVIAVGTPGVATAGNVSFFAADKTAGTLTCLFSLAGPAASAEFGRSLAVGDFDGDGAADLLVGSPPDHVYIYRGPIGAGATPETALDNAQSGGYSGAALAAMNLNSTGGDMALVGDPSGSVGTNLPGAGDVIELSRPPKGGTIRTLSEHSAGSSDGYGSAVAALPFCAAAPCATTQPLALVGSASDAYVYFTVIGADPRTK